MLNVAVSARQRIHFLYHFPAAYGGAEHRVYNLYSLLRPHADVRVWTNQEPGEGVRDLIPLKRIRAKLGAFPRKGVLVVVGGFFPIGPWIRFGSFSRVILIHNSPFHDEVRKTLTFLKSQGAQNIEIQFASRWLKEQFRSTDGEVQISLIDLDRFYPRPWTEHEGFVVGRHSRDTPDKHAPESLDTYRHLAREGAQVRLLGGSLLQSQLEGKPNIELMPVNYEAPAEFLRTLDCFYYRTHESFPEAHSRAVTEAMASGLPVVCHAQGGYRDFVVHGETGFLYEEEGEALEYLGQLRNDPELRQRVGQAAREKMEEMFGEKARAELVRFYLRNGAQADRKRTSSLRIL
jgi:glycosyltransferase involved in cell wall biosynthesis